MEIVALVVKDWLKGEADLLTFQDGDLAWRELLQADPDILIMDVNHPGMSGKAMLPRLAERGAEFPIVVITGAFGEQQVRELAGPSLNVQHLRKPSRWRHFGRH